MQAVGRSIEAHKDVVFLNSRVHADVHHWPGLIWIHEVNGAALQHVSISLENQIATREVYAAENHRLCCGALHMQIRRAVQTERAAYQADAVGCIDSDIEL